MVRTKANWARMVVAVFYDGGVLRLSVLDNLCDWILPESSSADSRPRLRPDAFASFRPIEAEPRQSRLLATPTSGLVCHEVRRSLNSS